MTPALLDYKQCSRKLVRGLALLGLLGVLIGCAPPALNHYQLADLNKGMSPADTARRLQVPSLAEGRIQVEGNEYWVQKYRLVQGGVSSEYYLAYDKDLKLIYWGYPDEFRRSSDTRLNALMSAVWGSSSFR